MNVYDSSALEESDYSFLLFLAILATYNGFCGEYGDCALYVYYSDTYNKMIVESASHGDLTYFQTGKIDDDTNKCVNYWYKNIWDENSKI